MNASVARIRRHKQPVGQVRAIGFEGVISPQRTPARLTAITVDAERCRVVAREQDFSRVSDIPLGELPETATPIEAIDARPGDAFLVLAADDIKTWAKYADAGGIFSPNDARLAMRPSGGGFYTAWLASPTDIDRVLYVLRDATRASLITAISDRSHQNIYDLAWRLVRCALVDDDLFEAAAALQKSPHPERGLQLIQSYFPSLTEHERQHRMLTATTRIGIQVARDRDQGQRLRAREAQ